MVGAKVFPVPRRIDQAGRFVALFRSGRAAPAHASWVPPR